MALSQLLPPGIQGFEAARSINTQREGAEIGQLGALAQLQAALQARKQDEELRSVLSQTGGDPSKAIQALVAAGTPKSLALAAQLQTAFKTQQQQGAVSSLSQLLSTGGYRPEPGALPLTGVEMTDQAALERVRTAQAAGQPANIGVPNPVTVRALSMLANPRGTTRELLHQQRGPDPITPYQQESLRLRQAQIDKPQTEPTHFERTVDDKGEITVHAFGRQGNIIKSTPTGGKSPSLLTTEMVRERQLATALETVKKPHLEVLNAYQRFNDIRATGDTAQANQFLVQQLLQMSRTGQRALSKTELERVLGSGDLGESWWGRGMNMISQMVSGVRTPETDKRLNDIADAMAKASADRLGQEIQNTRARTPAGINADRIIGTTPTIYGRFIITPSGRVHTFSSSAEAQAKLQEAAQMMRQ